MTPMLLVEIAAKSFVVAGAVLLLLAVTRTRSAAERSWVAHAGLIVLLALPAASLLLPRWRLLGPRMPEVLDAGQPAMVASAPLIDPGLVLTGLYAAGAGALLLASVVAVSRLFLLRRDASVLVDASWLTALARAQKRMGVKSGAALLVSDVVTSPVSWGLVRPTIVLNHDLVGAKDDAEAVISHELAHVVRLDWAKLLIARVVVALFWFNPLVWALARQCHQLREEAADDAVLGAEVANADYAALLIEAARHECRSLIAAHGVAPSKGSLHRRVTRVLDAAARRTPTGAGWAFGWLLGATVLAAPLAAATVERAEPAAVTIRSAQPQETPPRPIVTPRNPDGAVSPPRPVVNPRASTIPPRPVVTPHKAEPMTTPPPPVVVPRKSGAAITISPGVSAPAAPSPATSIGKAARVADQARATEQQRAEERARDKRVEAQARAFERQVEVKNRQVEARARIEPRVEAKSNAQARTFVKRAADGVKTVSIAADGAVRMEKPGKVAVVTLAPSPIPLTKADIDRIEAEADARARTMAPAP